MFADEGSVAPRLSSKYTQKRITSARTYARILKAIAKYPLRLAWLVWAPADQPCERREDVAIEILSEKAVAVGAKLDHDIQKIRASFGRAMELSVVGYMSLSLMRSRNGLWTQRSVKLQDETARNPRTSHPLLASCSSLQQQLTLRVASIALENPTCEPSASQPLGDSTTRRHLVGTLRHG